MNEPTPSAAYILPLESAGLAQRSINGAVITFAAQVIRTILTGISAIGLARLLPATDFGLLAIVYPVTGLMALLSNIGLFEAVLQQPNLTDLQVTSMFWVNISIGILLTAILILCSPLFAYLYKDPRLIMVIIILSLTILLSSLTTLQVAILNRMMLFQYIACIETLSLLTSTVLAIALAFAGWGYWSLVLSQIVGAICTALLAWFLSPWTPSRLAISKTANRMLAFGRNLTLFNVANYLNSTFDNLLIGFILGEQALGIYDRAWKLAILPLNQLLQPMNRVVLPILSRLSLEPSRYRLAFIKITGLMLAIVGPGLIAAIVSASVTVPGLLGERWRPMIPVFQYFCVGNLVTPLNQAAIWLFISQGRSREQLLYGVMAISANLVAYAVGVRWGVAGVVLASAISLYCLQAPLLLYAACRTGPVRLVDVRSAATAPFFGMFVSGVVLSLLWRQWETHDAKAVVMVFILSYLACVVSMLFLRSGRLIVFAGFKVADAVMRNRFRRNVIYNSNR